MANKLCGRKKRENKQQETGLKSNPVRWPDMSCNSNLLSRSLYLTPKSRCICPLPSVSTGCKCLIHHWFVHLLILLFSQLHVFILLLCFTEQTQDQDVQEHSWQKFKTLTLFYSLCYKIAIDLTLLNHLQMPTGPSIVWWQKTALESDWLAFKANFTHWSKQDL